MRILFSDILVGCKKIVWLFGMVILLAAGCVSIEMFRMDESESQEYALLINAELRLPCEHRPTIEKGAPQVIELDHSFGKYFLDLELNG